MSLAGSMKIAVAVALLMSWVPASRAQGNAGFSVFDRLDAMECDSVQLKLCVVEGYGSGSGPSLLLHGAAVNPDLSVFVPYRHVIVGYYGWEDRFGLQPLRLSGGVIQSIIDSIGVDTTLTTGAIGIAPFLSFALAIEADSALVYETLLNGQSAFDLCERIRAGLGFESRSDPFENWSCSIGLGNPIAPAIASDSVRVEIGEFLLDDKTGLFHGSIRVTNVGSEPIVGPFAVVLRSARDDVRFKSATGLTCNLWRLGLYYQNLESSSNSLEPSGVLTAMLVVQSSPSRKPIRVTGRLVHGVGAK